VATLRDESLAVPKRIHATQDYNETESEREHRAKNRRGREKTAVIEGLTDGKKCEQRRAIYWVLRKETWQEEASPTIRKQGSNQFPLTKAIGAHQ